MINLLLWGLDPESHKSKMEAFAGSPTDFLPLRQLRGRVGEEAAGARQTPSGPGGERLNSKEKTLALSWGRSLGRDIFPSVEEQMLVAEGLG